MRTLTHRNTAKSAATTKRPSPMSGARLCTDGANARVMISA